MEVSDLKYFISCHQGWQCETFMLPPHLFDVVCNGYTWLYLEVCALIPEYYARFIPCTLNLYLFVTDIAYIKRCCSGIFQGEYKLYEAKVL